MEVIEELLFPELICFENYGGNFEEYFSVIYKVFEKDFVLSQPKFNGKNVGAKKYPLVDDKFHRTFYHITHEGSDEENRTPDFRRMERIKFPKFKIGKCPHPHLLIWENIRGRDTRVLIWNEKEGYLTVLTEREDYYLLWTAYYVEREHQRKKYKKEYDDYIKAKTAQKN